MKTKGEERAAFDAGFAAGLRHGLVVGVTYKTLKQEMIDKAFEIYKEKQRIQSQQKSRFSFGA